MVTKIIFNHNQIDYDTEKASLIKIPHSQKKVWIPNSMIWPYKGRNVATIYPDFEYHTAGGLRMTAEDLVEAFGKNVITIEHHTPKTIEEKRIDANIGLIR